MQNSKNFIFEVRRMKKIESVLIVLGTAIALTGAIALLGSLVTHYLQWTPEQERMAESCAFLLAWGVAFMVGSSLGHKSRLAEIEGEGRALIDSYHEEKKRYETYKGSGEPEFEELAAQARVNANRAATAYAEYYRKYSALWKDGAPEGIVESLPFL